MYNREQKERFLEYYKEIKDGKRTMISRAYSVMDKIEPFENRWQMDICVQNDPDEIQKVVNRIGSVSSGNTDGRLLVLREYCKWCLNQGIEGASSVLLEIKKPTSDKFAEKVVGDPIQLQLHLNAIFPDESELSVHNTYRAFAWLSFMGFLENEALAIKCDEVDLDAMVVRHMGGEPLLIYPDALPCIKICKERKTFKYTHSSYKELTIDREREGGDLLLRGFISGVEQSPHYKLNNVLSRAQTTAARTGQITKRLNYLSIWQSGLFYRAFQNEKMGIQPDFRKAAIRRWLNIPKQVAHDRTEVDLSNDVRLRRIRSMQRSLELDYIRWKNLFHPEEHKLSRPQ